MSKIQWTNKTWNPIVGCSKVSAGCKNCYAISMAWRLQHIGHSAKKYAGTVEKTAGGQLNWTGKVNLSDKDLLKPLSWKSPKMIFVNSESDLFHESIPFDFIDRVFAVMALSHQHTFQVLTKRPARMLEYFKRPNYRALIMTELDLIGDEHADLFDQCCRVACLMPLATEPIFLNVWMGVSAEDQKTANERIPLLLQVPAAVRFLSCEPLIGPVDLMQDQLRRKDGTYPFPYLADKHRTKWLHNIDWVIVGGESGKDARPMHPDWARSLRDQCQAVGKAYFFKQFGEWMPVDMPWKQDNIKPLSKNERWLNLEGGHGFHGEDVYRIRKVGKKKSGRMLDGREWNEFPASGKRSEHTDDPDLHHAGFDI